MGAVFSKQMKIPPDLQINSHVSSFIFAAEIILSDGSHSTSSEMFKNSEAFNPKVPVPQPVSRIESFLFPQYVFIMLKI